MIISWELVFRITLIGLVFFENYVFFRFCIYYRILSAIFLKLISFILILASWNMPLYMLGFIILNLSVSFLTAFIYQPEYRFFFLKYRNFDLYDSNFIKRLLGINENMSVSTKFLDQLVEAVYNLAEKGIGALIIIERKVSLDYYINNGYLINSDVSGAILETIFNKNSPLHDGAIIIRDGKIVAAKCFVPLNTSEFLDIDTKVPHLVGARHRAGIGITQTTDAVSIVVSENNNTVSFCYEGKMLYDLKPEQLYQNLKNQVILNAIPFEKIERLS
ncbi:MAG: DNA integrity scanning protein DisA nucleotide-binding domain protein [bacterium]